MMWLVVCLLVAILVALGLIWCKLCWIDRGIEGIMCSFVECYEDDDDPDPGAEAPASLPISNVRVFGKKAA